MKNIFFLLLSIFFLSFLLSIAQAMTTTGTSAGVNETVTWSISGISDSDIHFLWRSSPDSSTEIVNYTAPISIGSTTLVHAEVQHAVDLTGSPVQFDDDGYIQSGLLSAQRLLSIDIPDNGTRWEAEKKCAWSYSSDIPVNTCSPPSVELDHAAIFRPYQRIPAYPQFHMQADKWIGIKDLYWTYTVHSAGSSMKTLYIYIIPQNLVGIDNDEENGLPKHARTEPDFKRKKPYGCNSCSSVGLPGYRVNMFNLRPVIQDPLFQWGGSGPSLQLTLTWNAGLGIGHTNFGAGWRFSYDAWLEESSSGVTIYQDTGGQLHFNIPPSGNANVVSTTDNTGDRTVVLENYTPIGTANYTSGWDGKFIPHPDGYNLKKTVDGDSSLRLFTLTSPDKKISYIFEGPSGTTGPVPLVALKDWNGNRVQITRNESGAITRITDAVNRTATLTYNQAGQCTLLTIPGGGQIHFSYSGTDMVQSIDLLGNKTNYTYNAGQFMTSMITEGRPWLFTWSNFNGHDYMSSVTDPQGAITHYSINDLIQNFYQTQVTDPTGRTFVYHYPSGHYSESDRPQSTEVTSDAEGRPVQIYQHGTTNHPRTLEYDANGNITKMTDYNGGVHTYTYNDRGQVTQYVDALSNTWTAQYDSHGNRTRIQSPAGRIYQFAYDSQGKLIREIDPEGNITSYSYDSFGNLKIVTDAEGSVTTYRYDTLGINLIGITDPLGATTSFAYDANHRLTRITHPDGTYKEYFYDCCAQTGVRNENGDMRTVTRSPSLQIISKTDYVGNTTTKTYDAAGRMITSRDSQGRITRTNYNNLGLAESVQDPLGDSISWKYDHTDTLFSHDFCQDPAAEVSVATTTFGMSSFGVPTRANGWQYVRDKMGRLLRIITPRDYWKRINYSRDADGYLTGKDVDGTSVATFVRDGNGLLKESTHVLGTDSYIRNGRGQVTRQTWYDGTTAVFGYDGAGRLHSLTYPDGSSALYIYDLRGRITNISWKGQSFVVQYDAVGNIVKKIRSNGIVTDITHDKNGFPTRIHHYAGGRKYLDLQGVRNAGSMLTRIQKSGDVLTWVPQLSPGTTNSTFTYDHSFTVVSRNGKLASTDPAGNQKTIPGPRFFSGTYDFLDQLTNWTAFGNSNGALYDGQRKLLQWTRNGIKRRFHYDERGHLLFETNDTGVVVATWLYSENQMVAMADSNGVYFYHNDLSGNISFLSDASGSIAAHYSYLPFGLQTESVTTVKNPFTFVGSFGVLDLQDGLYYMGSRTYDSVIRAFLSNDPIGMGVTVNAREYAANNPINLIDPDGRSSRYPSEWGEWMRSDYGNRSDSGPNWGYPPPSPKSMSNNSSIDPCKIESTILNTLSSHKKYGDAGAVLTILNDLRQGNYGDAVYDAAGTAVGKANPYAGAVTMFMGANPVGLTPDEEAEFIQKAKNDPNSYYNRHSKHSPSSSDFTLPPFSLDD